MTSELSGIANGDKPAVNSTINFLKIFLPYQ